MPAPRSQDNHGQHECRYEDRRETEHLGPAAERRHNQNCSRDETQYNEERPPRLVHRK
jgi:hypothetical protein